MPVSRSLRAALLATALAAALPGAVLTATPAAAVDAAICNKYCDTRDPALSPQDRQPVSATLSGRTFALHFDDADAMGWASIAGGAGGDEVWLDRSMDGGRTWSGGGKLGDTKVPAGGSGWRTLMYNVDDWNNRGVGALRACGQVGSAIACTPWARTTWNAWDRRTAAATALMTSFDRSTKLFGGNGWWTGANALTAVIDNARATGMNSYTYAVAETYDKNINAQGGNFTNEYLDDTGWWGLAWVDAYDLTGDSRYLNTARADADHMYANWNGTCGGGVRWSTNGNYKNAITNELFLQLTAALHNRIPGDTAYLQRARDEWNWFRGSGMVNADHLVNDGLNDACANNGQPTWTYNQGVVLGGLTELYRATGDTTLLTTARTLADASTTRLTSGGVLREPGEGDDCTSDGASFKGAYARGLGRLDAQLPEHPYAPALDTWANSAYAKDRNPLDQYGPHWAGGPGSTDYGCQQSALDLLNAAGGGTGGGLTVLPRTGWTASASATGGSDVPANMLDGSAASRWSTGTPMAAGQSVTVDTGAVRPLARITMDSGGSANDYARGYQVFLSADGTSWGSPAATGTGTGARVTADFPARNARYVKVVQTGTSTSWWSITEFNAYG